MFRCAQHDKVCAVRTGRIPADSDVSKSNRRSLTTFRMTTRVEDFDGTKNRRSGSRSGPKER